MKKELRVSVVFEEQGESLQALLWQFLCQNAVFWQEEDRAPEEPR